jgi:hypothetical protein
MIADMSFVLARLRTTNEKVIGQVQSSRYVGRTLLYSVRLQTPVKLRWRRETVREVLFSEEELKVIEVVNA